MKLPIAKICVVGTTILMVLLTIGERVPHWLVASSEGSAPAFERFLDHHPTGLYSKVAERRLDSLFYHEAVLEGTIAALDEYLANSRPSAYHSRALARRDSLRNAGEPLQAALTEGTIQALQHFLDAFPGHAGEADARDSLAWRTGTLRELMDRGVLDFRVRGTGSPFAVHLEVDPAVRYELALLVEAGATFLAPDPYQDLVVTRDQDFLVLSTDERSIVTIRTACAELPKTVPTNDVPLVYGGDAIDSDLARVLDSLDRLIERQTAGLDTTAVAQAAVWILTDNADYDRLGRLTSRTLDPRPFSDGQVYRTIGPDDVAWALVAINNAEVSLRSLQIWKDIPSIVAQVGGNLSDRLMLIR